MYFDFFLLFLLLPKLLLLFELISKFKSLKTSSFRYEKFSDFIIKFIFLYALISVYIKLAYFPQKVFMYKYKIYNNIALEGRDYLIKENLTLDEENPEALLLRSKVLSEENFNEGLLCIGRAGAGVNNIPIDIASKILIGCPSYKEVDRNKSDS